MKVAICGSMAFAKQMLEVEEELRKLGHDVFVPEGADKYANGLIDIEDKWVKIENDLIRNWYNVIKSSDAILVLNYTKNDIKDYVGGNSLIEMAFAHILNKKIFLMNSVPEMSYTDEIRSFHPTVINSDLSKIE